MIKSNDIVLSTLRRAEHEWGIQKNSKIHWTNTHIEEMAVKVICDHSFAGGGERAEFLKNKHMTGSLKYQVYGLSVVCQNTLTGIIYLVGLERLA
jgi:hypothetical protein